MTPAEVVGLCLALGGLLATSVGLFVRFVALPYLKLHLVDPLLLKLEELTTRDLEHDQNNRIAAYMFEGHMTASETDRSRLWAAVDDLRKDLTHHDHHG